MVSLSKLSRQASKLSSVPGLGWISPAANHLPTSEELAGFLKCQRLALRAAKETSSLLRPGWTEVQAASLLNTWLCDNGVRGYFHRPFAWFGERTRFDKIKTYPQFSPSSRVLRENEVFILDVAPILNGYVCDIGYTSCVGENAEYTKAMAFLEKLKIQIPALFSSKITGGEIWQRVENAILDAGYDNVHKRYPFAVLGHRVHRGLGELPSPSLWGFGWQSFWSIASRGILGQLLTSTHEGDLVGLWAIEPHLGTKTFGAKFEEILVVEKDRAYWLEGA
jgi:Xaa-Pro aminopeptidase